MITDKELEELKLTTNETRDKILSQFDNVSNAINETHKALDKAHEELVEAFDECSFFK